MKKVLLVLMFMPFVVDAQQLITSYYGDTVTIFRGGAKKIKNTDAATRFKLIENELDKRKDRIAFEKPSFYDDDFLALKTTVKDVCNSCDVSVYDREIEFYNNYLKKAKAYFTHVKDSTETATKKAFDEQEFQYKRGKDSIHNLYEKQQQESAKKYANSTSNFVGGSHGKLVVFCGYELEDVYAKFNGFMYNTMNYSSASIDTKNLPKINMLLGSAYTPRVGSGSVHKINVAFYGVRDEKNNKSIVDKCVIVGNWSEVADVFISYWETRMSINELKNKISITKNCIIDKITYSSLANGLAKIVVEKN